MNELVLFESQSLRNELCNEQNSEILQEIDNLITLPDTSWATKKQVADFYQTSRGTLDSTIKRNRSELREDGYKVLSKKDFQNLHNASFKIPNRGIAVFPRRAVLRIGMLLRDSPVAQKVRTYLLNREFEARHLSADLSSLFLHQVRMFSEILAGQEIIIQQLRKWEGR